MSVNPSLLGSPAVQELLGRLVDRLDSAEARGSARAQSVPLNKTLWPTLFRQPYESEREDLWEQACALHRAGLISIAPERALHSGSGWHESPRITVADPARVRAAAGRPRRIKSGGELWREAVDAHLVGTPEAKRVAATFCIELVGHGPDEIVARLNQLPAFAESGMLLREVSARLFWGMSKVLDNRQALVAAVLGADDCPFAESPIQLQVLLPLVQPRGVLFIENAASFERAIRDASPAYEGLAVVFASGFKASAKRLRTREGASLFYARAGALTDGAVAAFEAWLFGRRAELPVAFWGDLDWSGMRILKTLREAFGDVTAWQPGYAPMLQHALTGNGHQPEAADKRGQAPVKTTGCTYADSQLVPALTLHGFVDQELFRP